MKPLTRALWTALAVLAAVLLARVMQPHFDDTNVAMVYMLAVVVVVAATLGLWPGITACLLGILLFDYVNVEPYFAFTRRELEYAFTLGVMLATAVTISTLSNRLRRQADESEARAARTAALFSLSEALASDPEPADIVAVGERHLAPARVQAARADAGPEAQAHLRALARLVEQALDRAALRGKVQASEARAQQEALRSSILGALSHDLRTPLASIIGASSTLLDAGDSFSHEARQKLRQVIYEEAVHMQRMVDNLLDLARVRSGEVAGEFGWQAIEEIVGSALASFRRRAQAHRLVVEVPADLPLIRCDGVLIERVLANLLENAAKYSPPGTCIGIRAAVDGDRLVLLVSDEGPGVPPALRERVFEPFFSAGSKAGPGLGLAICRGIVEAHGGSIAIADAPSGGAQLCVRLPIPAEAPDLAREETGGRV